MAPHWPASPPCCHARHATTPASPSSAPPPPPAVDLGSLLLCCRRACLRLYSCCCFPCSDALPRLLPPACPAGSVCARAQRQDLPCLDMSRMRRTNRITSCPCFAFRSLPRCLFLSLPRSPNPGMQGRLRRSFSPSTTPGEDQDRDLLEQERFWDRQGHLKFDYVLPPRPRPTSTTTTRHVHLPPSSEPLRTASTSASTMMPDA